MAKITKTSASLDAVNIYEEFIGAATSSTYTRITDGTYNPTTGTSDDTEATQKVNIIFLEIDRKQDNFDQIAPGDIKAIIPKANLKYDVETGDTMSRGTKNYTVKGHTLVAADSLWKLHLEETF